jgi:hypothetical protein
LALDFVAVDLPDIAAVEAENRADVPNHSSRMRIRSDPCEYQAPHGAIFSEISWPDGRPSGHMGATKSQSVCSRELSGSGSIKG